MILIVKRVESMKRGLLVICIGLVFGVLTVLTLTNLARSVLELKKEMKDINAKMELHRQAILMLHDAALEFHGEDVYVNEVVSGK